MTTRILRLPDGDNWAALSSADRVQPLLRIDREKLGEKKEHATRDTRDRGTQRTYTSKSARCPGPKKDRPMGSTGRRRVYFCDYLSSVRFRRL